MSWIDPEDLVDSIALHAGAPRYHASSGFNFSWCEGWAWGHGLTRVVLTHDDDGNVELLGSALLGGDILSPTLADADRAGRALAALRGGL